MVSLSKNKIKYILSYFHSCAQAYPYNNQGVCLCRSPICRKGSVYTHNPDDEAQYHTDCTAQA